MPLFSSDYLQTRGNKNKPFLTPLAGNKFALLVPIYNLLIVIDMQNRTMAPYHIPGVDSFRFVHFSLYFNAYFQFFCVSKQDIFGKRS